MNVQMPAYVTPEQQEHYMSCHRKYVEMHYGEVLADRFARRDTDRWIIKCEILSNARSKKTPGGSLIARDASMDKYCKIQFDMSWDEYQDLLTAQGDKCGLCGSEELRFSPKLPYHPVVVQNIKILICRHCKPGVSELLKLLGTNLASETK